MLVFGQDSYIVKVFKVRGLFDLKDGFLFVLVLELDVYHFGPCVGNLEIFDGPPEINSVKKSSNKFVDIVLF